MRKQFQGLRFLAFLFVFLAHASGFRWFAFKDATCASWAVSFFFALSGFMIGFGDRGDPFSWSGAASYVWRKIRRFYPLMFLSIVLSTRFAKGLICWLSGGNPCPGTWECLPIRHLLLVQSWWREGVFEFNAVCWFLSTLIVLYLVARLAVPLLRRLGTGMLLAAAAIGFAAVAGWNAFVFARGWDLRFWFYIFPPAKMPEFVAFVCLGLVCSRKKERLETAFGGFWRGTLFDLALAAVLVGAFVRFDNETGSVVRWLLPNVLIFCFFTFSGGILSRLGGCRILDFLGTLSMPMFLLHGNVLNFVQGRLAAAGLLPVTTGARCLCFCMAFALSMAAGYAYLRIESLLRGKKNT